MLLHVPQGTPQAAVGFDLLLIKPLGDSRAQSLHYFTALGAVVGEPLLIRHLLGLSILPINFRQAVEHPTTLGKERRF